MVSDLTDFSSSVRPNITTPMLITPTYTIGGTWHVSGIKNIVYYYQIPRDGMDYCLCNYDHISTSDIWLKSNIVINSDQVWSGYSSRQHLWSPGYKRNVRLYADDVIYIGLWHLYTTTHDLIWYIDFWREPNSGGM